jgi:hypothetical protein
MLNRLGRVFDESEWRFRSLNSSLQCAGEVLTIHVRDCDSTYFRVLKRQRFYRAPHADIERLAEQTARKRIKELLRQRGVKLCYVPVRKIIAQAKQLATHPEIIAEARVKEEALGYGPPLTMGDESA